jgi:hypothetical protein
LCRYIEKQFNRAITDKDIRRRIRRKIVVPVRPPGQRRKPGDEDDPDADEFELNPTVGLRKLNPVDSTYSLKAPWFQPLNHQK